MRRVLRLARVLSCALNVLRTSGIPRPCRVLLWARDTLRRCMLLRSILLGPGRVLGPGTDRLSDLGRRRWAGAGIDGSANDAVRTAAAASTAGTSRPVAPAITRIGADAVAPHAPIAFTAPSAASAEQTGEPEERPPRPTGARKTARFAAAAGRCVTTVAGFVGNCAAHSEGATTRPTGRARARRVTRSAVRHAARTTRAAIAVSPSTAAVAGRQDAAKEADKQSPFHDFHPSLTDTRSPRRTRQADLPATDWCVGLVGSLSLLIVQRGGRIERIVKTGRCRTIKPAYADGQKPESSVSQAPEAS